MVETKGKAESGGVPKHIDRLNTNMDKKNLYILGGAAIIIVVIALLWWAGLLRLPR